MWHQQREKRERERRGGGGGGGKNRKGTAKEDTSEGVLHREGPRYSRLSGPR